MGLDNRDYLRDEARRYGEGGGFSGGGFTNPDGAICRKIIIATAVVFVAQFLFSRPTPGGVLDSLVIDWFRMETPKVLTGQIWRLLTYAFCHSPEDLLHIVFNMLLLFFFGRRLEAMYGHKEFLWFYITAAVVSALTYMAIDAFGDPRPMIGASGAVMAVMMLYAIHFPTDQILLFFVIPIQMRVLVVLYAIWDLYPFLRQFSDPTYTGDGVAHAAHLGGLAFGYLYQKRGLRLMPAFGRFSTWWKVRKRGLKVVSAPTEGPSESRKSQKLKSDMDTILKKISEQGEESLTTAERKVLEAASRELRDRR